ncbi:MAG: hypothetical protein UT22_C0048G0009 [Parcubacteria group bacterium GW2011_GWC2_39_11]|nr:MAG: hypothetical protein UT22_C0048G0009 [Parcubacteria group bacterium GW2011_GWC2_39_11]
MKKLLWFSLIGVAVYFMIGQVANLVGAWNAGTRDAKTEDAVAFPEIAPAPALGSMAMPQMPAITMPALPSFKSGSASSSGSDSDWKGTVTVGTGFAWDNLAIMREADANTQAVWTAAMAQAWDAQALAYATAYTEATPALSRAMKAQIVGEMRTEWARQSYNQTVYRTQAAGYPADYANITHNRWARDTGWIVGQYIFLVAAVAFLIILGRRELIQQKKLQASPDILRAGGWSFFTNQGQVQAVQDDHTAWDQWKAAIYVALNKKAGKKEEPAVKEGVNKGA